MMNFENLFKIYPEVNNLNNRILALLEVISGVDAILDRDIDAMGLFQVEEITEYGHPSACLEAEQKNQDFIMKFLLEKFREAFFIAEEKKGCRINRFSEDKLDLLSFYELLYGIDPLDGTANFWSGLYEWSTSVGVMEWGVHIGGMIYGPQVNGGMCVFGERGKGVFLVEGGGNSVQRVKVSPRTFNESVLLTGVDFAWQPAFNAFLNQAAKKSLVTKSVGSCALGLACVVAGKAGALVQPLQKPWDWFAGYPLVEEAGGKVKFYHYRDGFITFMDKPDSLAYSSVKPNIGFIAGNPSVVDSLAELLQDYYLLCSV